MDLYLDGGRHCLDIRPPIVRPGDLVQLAFRALRVPGATRVPCYDIGVFDARRLRVATVLREPVRPTGGVVFVDWDGRDDQGLVLRPGSYQLRVEGVGNPLRLERTMLVEW